MAHCNFHLRPGDCDRDEQFVRQLAQRYGVRIHVGQFDTSSFAARQGLCIEDAARRLRYDYFEQLRQQEGYAAIWVAHHRDDSAETFFLNLLRGTGLSGLHGILPQQGFVVRPLLPFGRDEIESYAREQGLMYVEDVTNGQLDYKRNQVRHQLIPLLRTMQPAFDRTMQETMAHLRSTERLYAALLAPLRRRCMTMTENGVVECSLRAVAETLELLGASDDEELRRELLFELLREYGFGASAVAAMCSASQSGKRFYSHQYEVLVNRGRLLLRPLESIPPNDAEQVPQMGIRQVSAADFCHDVRHLPPGMAAFDADQLHQPVRLRHWQTGDRFQPLGMKHGTQLVSDFFSDHKLSRFDKERQWLLVDASDAILWIVGRRTSHAARITPATRQVLLVEVEV